MIILDRAENVLRTHGNAPTAQSLHALFSLVSPDLPLEEVTSTNNSARHLRLLRLRLHPDKHGRENAARATKVYQDVNEFYELCVQSIVAANAFRPPSAVPPPAAPPPPSPSAFDYDARLRHPYLPLDVPSRPPRLDPRDLARLVALQCVNARGSIVHGRRPQRLWHGGDEDVEMPRRPPSPPVRRGAMEVFRFEFGGCGVLRGPREIRAEVARGGPVVAGSYRPGGEADRRHPGAFVSADGRVHEALIVGWRRTKGGDVWIVCPLRRRDGGGGGVVEVPCGQDGIDEFALYPTDPLVHVPWQSGPYLSLKMTETSGDGWTAWNGMILWLSSAQMEDLGGCFGHGLIEAAKKGSTFTLRDYKALAHSRTSRLVDMEWYKGKQKWKVEVHFV